MQKKTLKTEFQRQFGTGDRRRLALPDRLMFDLRFGISRIRTAGVKNIRPPENGSVKKKNAEHLEIS